MKEGYVMNPETNRIISKKTAKYKRLVKLGLIVEDEPKVEKIKPKEPIKQEPEPELPEPEPEFNESKLQEKLSEISTNMIQTNLKKVVQSQKLTDDQMDDMLKRMLYEKLCIKDPDEPKKSPKKKEKKSKTKKAKFKVVEPSSSDSESESD